MELVSDDDIRAVLEDAIDTAEDESNVKALHLLLQHLQAGTCSNEMDQRLPSEWRPFAWWKKWARDWQDVKYCSHRCRNVAQVAPSIAGISSR
jgi:hypothetical protein